MPAILGILFTVEVNRKKWRYLIMDEETFEEYRDALVQSELSEQTIRMYMRVALQFEQYRQGRLIRDLY